MYKNRGRDSKDYKELRGKTDDMIARANKKYYDKEAQALMERGSHQLAFNAMANLQTKEGKNKWKVSDMRRDLSEQELSERLADHYASISQNFVPIMMASLPKTYDRPVEELNEVNVAERLKAMKKPKSYVSIDLPPSIVNEVASTLAPVLTNIINKIRNGEGWPSLWSNEEVSTIPKVREPESFDQCRGISCTSIFSKLAETYMLDMLQEEIEVGPTQYGGIKGVGTDHLLAEMVTNVLEDLDDNRSAVTVMTIDYQKAFNRMDHNKCVQALADKGASTQSIRVAASFLEGRTMRAKVGQTLSSVRSVPGGAPQGTKSGNFLFTLTIDDVEEKNEGSDLAGGVTDKNGIIGQPLELNDVDDWDEEEHNDSFDSEESFNVGRRDLRIGGKRTRLDDTPTRRSRTLSQPQCESEMGFPPRWERRPPWVLKFVDDVTTGARNLVEHSTRHITTKKEKRTIHAGDLEDLFNTIKNNSEAKGMVVNPNKTQLMCITRSINYDISSYIEHDDERIESTDKMKVLGFTLDNKCTAIEHLKVLKKKFANRIWIIRHLKRAKIESDKLLKVFCSLIRPIFDYASVIYGPMLTAAQRTDLERMQAIALKTILGWNHSYRSCLNISGLETLSDRRRAAEVNFAERTVANKRFKYWFPDNSDVPYNLRRRERYHTEFARSERLQNAPIYNLRRILNDAAPPTPFDFDELDN